MKTIKLIVCLSLVFGGTILALATTATVASPTLEWTEQLGTSSGESSLGVSADGLGNVYMSGYTEGSLEGTNAGGEDAFIVKFYDPSYPEGDFDEDFDVDGADFLKWQRGFGDIYDSDDFADWENNFATVAASLASITGADLSSGSASTAVPEPNTLLLGTLAAVGLLLRRRR